MPLPSHPSFNLLDQNVRYAGYSLESAKNAYVDGEIEIDDFEDAVELILLEEANPTKDDSTNLRYARGEISSDQYLRELYPYGMIASVSVADYPSKPWLIPD